MGEDLSNHDWPVITQEVLSYVFARFYINDNAIKEDKVQLIVDETIERFLSGDRIWNKEKEPDLANFLKSVACSIISQKYGKRAKRPDGIEIPSGLENIGNIEGVVEKQSLLQLFGKSLDADTWDLMVKDCIKGNQDVELISLLLEEGKKAREIALDLHLDRQQVYQLIRNLKTCLKSKTDVLG